MSSNDVRFLDFGPFRFDVRNRLLTRNGLPVPLKPKAADLLLALLHGRGDVVSKEDLLKTVWPDTFVEEGNVSFYIHEIRAALREGADGEQYIENRPRRGYRIAVQVREVRVEPPAASEAPTAGPPEGTAFPAAARIPPAIDVPTTGPEAEPSAAPPLPPLLVSVPPPPLVESGPYKEESPATRRPTKALVMSGVAMLALAIAGVVLPFEMREPPRLEVLRYRQVTSDRREKQPIGPLLSDGSRVYVQQDPASAGLTVYTTVGDSTEVPPNLRDLVLLDVHAGKGGFLAFLRTDEGSFRQLWAVAASGTRRRVGTLACGSAAWSPSGEEIACTTEAGIHIASPDGKPLMDVAPIPGTPMWPRWAPNAPVIRFTLKTAGSRRPREKLWEVRTDGRGLRPLMVGTDDTDECCGLWTHDGRHFMFISKREGRADLRTLSEPSGLFGRGDPADRALTDGPLGFAMPGLSRDGSHLLAVSVPHDGELVRFDRKIGAFVPHLGGLSAVWVTFSPDAEWVAYTRLPDHTLWRARADGRAAHQLTFAPMIVDGLAWSPDSKRLAFRASRPGKPFKVFTMAADGGEPEPLTLEDREQGIPSWSADGFRLTFGEVPVEFGLPKGHAIQVYDVRARQFSPLPGSTNLWSPRWSPDGRYIAAVTITNRSLRLYDVARTAWIEVDADRIDNLTWSRDSRYLYYHTEGVKRALRRVAVPKGPVEEIVSLDGYPIKAYWWSGLALDDSPLVLRTAGFPEIYALELESR
jgi:DNA-binding winged helix-turn-helix (wHTH) protein/Tol biopolymer transport system component